MRGSLAALALCGAMAHEAQARVFVSVGVPLFFPPYYAPPPVYYPPYYAPPVVYAPPANNFSYAPPAPSVGYAQSCQAGAYVCPLAQDTPPGGRCSCPGNNGRRIPGQAN
jgi:hypothetical protein